MQPRLIYEHPLAKDGQGRLKCRVGTVFPSENAIVTIPGIHATQRMAYLDLLDGERQAAGQPALTRTQWNEYWESAVDLIMEGNVIQIRPDPQRMQLAFAADEVLQRLPVSKRQIRFLNVLNEQVREAIKRRGEYWRITRLPSSVVEMEYMILGAKIGVGGMEIYYYNRTTGTRYLTCQEFCGLDRLDDWQLRKHLLEIQDLSSRLNSIGNLEVDFFQAEPGFRAEYQACDFRELSATDLRQQYRRLRHHFREAVTAPFRTDNLALPEWRCRMFASLMPGSDEMVNEEELLGLSSEFFMQIQWLPGARIEESEMIFDSALDDSQGPSRTEFTASEEISRGLVHNLLREYGVLEYVNVGCVVQRLSNRPPSAGRRGVFLIEMKLSDSGEELLKFVRLQKWGVGERLDDGKDLLQAILETEEYVDYVLDRRLGCRQLGMNLAPRMKVRKLREIYRGKNPCYHGVRIWTPYFERDYLHGMATDKILPARFEEEEFALRFARLLGHAAAPNIIVGRWSDDGHVTFNDGDEVLIEDRRGLPESIVVADITGSFVNFHDDLTVIAAAHAEPIRRVGSRVSDLQAFREIYIAALVEHYTHIRDEYHKQRKAFDTLFRNQPVDAGGSLAYRWEQVLQRLDKTTPQQIEQAVRAAVDDVVASLRG
jgi:hypothetical protein